MNENTSNTNNVNINFLAQEYAVVICINDISYAVMMVSPTNLEEYALGFLYGEQLISSKLDVHNIEISLDNENFTAELHITLANRCLHLLTTKKRRLAGQSGCGICGVEALQQAMPTLKPLPLSNVMRSDKLADVRAACKEWQTLSLESGALHAAFLLDTSKGEHEGNILACREDIGRHNALDKLIGYLLANSMDIENKALLMTSRCSIELVHKTINIGIKHLISLASPSHLAVKVAKQTNLNLIHLSKYDGAIFYNKVSNAAKADNKVSNE